jgi:hypothetical protein
VNICHIEETNKKPTVWKDILHYKLLRWFYAYRSCRK